MTLHKDLFTFLKGNTAIAAAMKGGIHHEKLPQSLRKFPALTFQLITEVEVETDQDYPSEDKIDQARFQFDVHGQTSDEVVDAMIVLHDALRNHGGTFGTKRVQRVERSGNTDIGERFGDKNRPIRSADYTFWYL